MPENNDHNLDQQPRAESAYPRKRAGEFLVNKITRLVKPIDEVDQHHGLAKVTNKNKKLIVVPFSTRNEEYAHGRYFDNKSTGDKYALFTDDKHASFKDNNEPELKGMVACIVRPTEAGQRIFVIDDEFNVVYRDQFRDVYEKYTDTNGKIVVSDAPIKRPSTEFLPLSDKDLHNLALSMMAAPIGKTALTTH